MIKWIWLLFSTLFIRDIGASSKWCQTDLCRGQHVLCEDNGFHSTCPKQATAVVEMSWDMIYLIVDQHNEYRNKFAGGMGQHAKAARMTTIEWDPELAKVAGALVRRCEPIRDQCAITPNYNHGEVSYSLEKYFCMTSKKDALRKQLDHWFDPSSKDEVHKLFFSWTSNQQELSKNYFQVLRDRANRVGCAIVEYIRPALVHQLLKCVYNCGVSLCEDEDNPVYEDTDDEPASECMKGTNKKYTNLCHKDELVKSCSGGSLFEEPENDYNDGQKENVEYDYDVNHMSTVYTLPTYDPNDVLPPLPDNPDFNPEDLLGSPRKNGNKRH
ncbi:venom allergen 5 isoform X2 [Drosophila teissieri]|uniref:venom allergen 5 isoform X2 n=1 Tax=Drosophila teissieri TaxID=7243 RepID=UPI001CB9FDD9|nr:venom allergen 5 isoform X2 [Drosophila teissieri]